ncbi:hypothetical protein CSKR_102456, partial [Clonorchis sinensis]
MMLIGHDSDSYGTAQCLKHNSVHVPKEKRSIQTVEIPHKAFESLDAHCVEETVRSEADDKRFTLISEMLDKVSQFDGFSLQNGLNNLESPVQKQIGHAFEKLFAKPSFQKP